jgi:hypothetical protein
MITRASLVATMLLVGFVSSVEAGPVISTVGDLRMTYRSDQLRAITWVDGFISGQVWERSDSGKSGKCLNGHLTAPALAAQVVSRDTTYPDSMLALVAMGYLMGCAQ